LLNEEDVPRAKFVSGEVSEHSIVQLKRWLQCRGLKSSGKKETLVDRQVMQRGPYLQCFIITPNVFVKRSRINIRQKFFCNRIVGVWNDLPAGPEHFRSLSAFIRFVGTADLSEWVSL
jgi:hypothetical protein